MGEGRDRRPVVDEETLREILGPLRARPRFVVGQLGQSLDGRIATAQGHSHYINGPADIHRLHALRALVDAVVVGSRTVASDDPRLTVRHAEGPDPTRVVLDSSGRLDPELGVFQDGEAPTLWVRPDSRPVGVEVGAHVEVAALPRSDEGFPPAAVLDLLADHGLDRVLVEGGGRTVSSFLAAGVMDRLHVSVAPLIIGSGRPSITLPEVATLDEALRPGVRHFHLGNDLLFDLDLRTTSG